MRSLDVFENGLAIIFDLLSNVTNFSYLLRELRGELKTFRKRIRQNHKSKRVKHMSHPFSFIKSNITW